MSVKVYILGNYLLVKDVRDDIRIEWVGNRMLLLSLTGIGIEIML